MHVDVESGMRRCSLWSRGRVVTAGDESALSRTTVQSNSRHRDACAAAATEKNGKLD